MLGVRSSRRVPPLREEEIDHEINLVDHSASIQAARDLSPARDEEEDNGNKTDTEGPPLTPSDSQAPLRDGAAPISQTELNEDQDVSPKRSDPSDSPQHGGTAAGETSAAAELGPPDAPATTDPSSASPAASRSSSRARGKQASRQSAHVKRRPRPPTPETAIDILYENERGGFLCGIPLFSSAALGNLDPPAWTNVLHKPSPTDVKTAQVPDPSWQWSWPEWRVNRDPCLEDPKTADGDSQKAKKKKKKNEQIDQEGWEYSFMFSKKFSWHGPRWYNSFVRRRAWIRRRIKKPDANEVIMNGDPHLMNEEYFTVVSPTKKQFPQQPPSQSGQAGNGSLLNDGVTAEHGASVMTCHGEDEDVPGAGEAPKIETMDELMARLRRARIDREKLDAVQSYLEHALDDLPSLQEHMHEVMAIFVFQASRRLLLTRLIKMHDEYAHKLEGQQREQQQPKKGEAESSPARGETQEEEGAASGAGEEGDAKKRQAEELQGKVDSLSRAIKHADEEVRRLEYWSDVREMAESGESGGAVAGRKGWDDGWEGIDLSGARGANKEELPSS